MPIPANRSRRSHVLKSRSKMVTFRSMVVAATAWLAVTSLLAAETPKQGTGEADDPRPYLRVPFLASQPTMNGEIAPGEWDMAARVTGFGNYNQGALVPEELQPSWRLAFDEKNLYLVSEWPLYPAGSIKARNKRGDEGGSNPGATGWPDGLLGDDHVEIEISPWPDPNMARTSHFYKLMANPYGAIVDQRREDAVGWDGFEWESGAEIGCKIQNSIWTMELAIPWASIGFTEAPADGTALTVQLVNASDSEQAYLGWVPQSWRAFTTFATIVLDRTVPAVRIDRLGELMDGKVALSGAISNAGDKAQTCAVELVVEHPDKGEIFRRRTALQLPAGGEAALAMEEGLKLEQAEDILWGKGSQLRNRSTYRYRLAVLDEQDRPLYRQTQRFFKRPADLQVALFDFLASSRGVSGEPAITTAYLPSYDRCEVSVDVDILGIKAELRAAKTVEVVVERLVSNNRQPNVAGTTYRLARHVEAIPASGLAEFIMEVPALPLGSYGFFTRLLDEKGKVLFTKMDAFKRHRFEWEGNTLGKGEVVIPPWTPISVKGRTLGVWGREITLGENGLPASIKSQGDELLATPMQLEGEIGGRLASWQTEAPCQVTRAEPGVIETRAEGRFGELPVTVETRTEYDGFTVVTLTLRPEGRVNLGSMRLAIPLAEPVDTVSIIGGSGRMPDLYGEFPAGEGVLWGTAKSLPNTAGIHGKYIAAAYLGNGERGLSYTCWSDQGWMLDDAKDTADLRRVNGVAHLVLHLANTAWTLDATRTLCFALQATPVRPLTPGYRTDNNPLSEARHDPRRPLDTAAIGAGWLSCYGGAPGTDQLTIYDETDWASMRDLVLRYKRDAWPKYDRLILNYTASNTLGLGMREYETYAGEWAFQTELKPNPAVAHGYYNEFGRFGTRQQTRVRCDLVPSAVDMRVWAFDQMQKRAGLNGYWWDHEAYWSSASLIRGTAYVRDDGKVQGILNIPLFREMFKRMATVSHQNGMFNVQGRYPHSGNVPAINGYCSYLWATEGPWYTPNLAFDQYDTVGSLAGYRALVGRWLGVPITIRSSIQDRDFKLKEGERPYQSRCSIGLALLHDVGLSGMHPELSRQTARALDGMDVFDDERTEWVPYWRSGQLAVPEEEETVVTAYINRPKRGEIEALAVVFNTRKETRQMTVALRGDTLLGRPIRECLDLETGKALEARQSEGNATVSLALDGRDYRLIHVR